MILVVVASTREWLSAAQALGLPRWHLSKGGVRQVNNELALLRTGVGWKKAAEAAHLIEELKPRVVLHVGYAGALRAGLNAGDLLAVTSLSIQIVDPDQEVLEIPEPTYIDDALIASVRTPLSLSPGRMAQGGLLTVSRFIDRSEDKLRLGAQGPYIACDMEATVIHAAAVACGAHYAGLRVISDASHHEMPPGLRDHGLRRVLKWGSNPARASMDAWRMLHGWTRAAEALRRGIPEVVESLRSRRNDSDKSS